MSDPIGRMPLRTPSTSSKASLSLPSPCSIRPSVPLHSSPHFPSHHPQSYLEPLSKSSKNHCAVVENMELQRPHTATLTSGPLNRALYNSSPSMSPTSITTARPFDFTQASSASLDPQYLPFLLPRANLPFRHSIALSHPPIFSEYPQPVRPAARPGHHGHTSSASVANMVFDLSVRGRKASDAKVACIQHPAPLSNIPQNGSLKHPPTSQGLSIAENLRRKMSKKRSLSSLLSTSPTTDDSLAPRHRRILKGSPPASTPVPEDEVMVISSSADNDVEFSGLAEKETFEERDYFLTRYRMKHHPYPREDAPYMQAYNPILLDNECSTEKLLGRINSNHSPSFHAYKKPPTKILDLGCGRGRWIVESATFWKGSKFTGFDLVDVGSNAWEVDEAIAENITWVRGNFLKYDLPFADKSFDLVRIANLTLCVPYEKWAFVLKQVKRVLVPLGRLELIDDQIFYPYDRPPFPERSPTTPKPTFNTLSNASVFDDDVETNDSDSTYEGSVKTVMPEDADVTSGDSKPQSLPLDPAIEWDNRAAMSRGIEVIFEDMLKMRYRIHPRPHEFILVLMRQVFGESNARKFGSFALGIAPEDYLCDKDAENSSIESTDSGGKKIKWLPGDSKKDKPKEKDHRSSGSSDTIIIPPPQTPEVISAKAASRLAIDTSPRQSTASRSPGMILYPSTFIPMSAAELEEHASKHLHVLLGCKYPLIEYLSDFKDENGQRLVCDQELTDLFWDYECFRRRRFNWPSEPEELQYFPMSDVFISQPSPTSPNFRKSSGSDNTIFGRPRSGSTTPPSKRNSYNFEDSTHVRSIRVFEAYKIGDS